MGTVRRAIEKRQLEQEPWLAWNEFVDLIATTSYHELDELQRVAQLAFLYDAEVQNGGHRQYFENRRDELLEETQLALKTLDAACQADVLEEAAGKWRQRPRDPVKTVEGYVQTALEGEFETLDQAYYRCRPSIQELLERYLADNFNRFIQVRNDV